MLIRCNIVSQDPASTMLCYFLSLCSFIFAQASAGTPSLSRELYRRVHYIWKSAYDCRLRAIWKRLVFMASARVRSDERIAIHRRALQWKACYCQEGANDIERMYQVKL